MSERPKPGADPEATVIPPARSADPEATVMMSVDRADEDATVMIPALRADDDATVLMPAPLPGEDAEAKVAAPLDDEATVMLPAAPVDPDGTVMIPPQAFAEPDPEATIAIPTPGRRREQTVAVTPPAPLVIAPASDGNSKESNFSDLGGLNPLVAAGNPVLAVVAQLRHTLVHPDPRGLLSSLVERVDAFESATRAEGSDEVTVACASQALCALVDESAGSTPWGAEWVESGLLARKHGDKSGGETFFRLLEEKSAEPAPQRDLLEFFYVCLALGFEGRYRQGAEGREALLGRRARLLDQLRELRPPRDGELAGHWRGVQAPARRPTGAIGVWAACATAAGVLAALYAGFSVSLGGLSDPVARELAQLMPPVASAPSRPAGVAETPRIAERLAAEIGRGEVAVVDAAGMSTIVILSDRLFGSGSARLEPAIEPVVRRLAEALDQLPGAILVTGHTDDVPIRTARFPSNWELSAERAASVLALMAGKLKEPARLRAEGLADSAPAVPNDSAANRARNRRVEIVLRSAP